jgi:hypothetical protein
LRESWMAEPSPAMTVLRYCTFLTTPSRKGGRCRFVCLAEIRQGA